MSQTPPNVLVRFSPRAIGYGLDNEQLVVIPACTEMPSSVTLPHDADATNDVADHPTWKECMSHHPSPSTPALLKDGTSADPSDDPNNDSAPHEPAGRRLSRRVLVARAAAGAAAAGLILPGGVVAAQEAPPIEPRDDPAEEGDGSDEPYVEPEEDEEDETEGAEPEPEESDEIEPEPEPTDEPDPTADPESEQPSVILDEAEQSGDRYFASTGHNLGAPFLELWLTAGGDAGPGIPLSEARFIAGPGIIRQDFEALAFEYDPTVETGETIRAVPLPPEAYYGLVDAKAFEIVSGCEFGESSCRYFDATGHTITGDFASFWREHGGAQVLGNPLSEQAKKGGVTTQIFERAVVDIDASGMGTLRKVNTPIAAAAYGDDPAFLPAPPSLGTTTLVTASDGLRIRANPSANGEIITVIAENTEFIAAPGEHSDWVPGYADGFSGWVSSEYLKEPPPLPRLAKNEWKLDVWQGAALSDTNLRVEPRMSSTVARPLAYGSPVTIVDWIEGEKVVENDAIWALADDGTFIYGRDVGRSAPVQPPPIPAGAPKIGKWIDIHLTQQLLVAYEGQEPVRTVVVTSGKPGWETPEGSFAINTRVANETMESGSIGAEEFYVLEDVLFTQYFTDRGHALHFAWWKTPPTIGRPGSHGCINLLLDDARFLWEWAEIGTAVICHY